MYKKRSKKRIVIIIAVIAAAAIAAGVIAANMGNKSKTVDVYPVSMLRQGMWNDNELSAQVKEGRNQSVLMQEGLIKEICVSDGQEVKKGDVLMRYDVESFKLTVKSDEAKIASLTAALEKAKKQLGIYKTLIPSEYAPQPTETVIHHKADPVATFDVVDIGTTPSSVDEIRIYNCNANTQVTAGFLSELSRTGGQAKFVLYKDNVEYASWLVDGSSLNNNKPLEPEQPEEPSEPETPSEPDETPDTETPEEPEQPDVPEEPTQPVQKFEDWTVGSGLEVFEDGTVSIDFSQKHYGVLNTVVPGEAEWDEYIYSDNYTVDELGNYAYSKEELAQMIKDQTERVAGMEIDLKSAKLTYEKDKLTSETGEVKAVMDGTVTELKDPDSISNGEVLMNVKGKEKCIVEVYVNEMDLANIKKGEYVSVTAYESGSFAQAVIDKIGTEPVEDYYSGGNPNNSFYPVEALVEDDEAQFRTGEYCSANLESAETSDSIYLPKMYVRSDSNGKYVMLADEDMKLKKQYIKSGGIMWGYLIEVKSGITDDDKIAFPYGANIKEGTAVSESSEIMY